MLPVNTKSLFAVLCNCMDKLDKGEMSIQEAHAMSKLVGQANNLLNYELKRAALMCNDNQFHVYQKKYSNKKIEVFKKKMNLVLND